MAEEKKKPLSLNERHERLLEGFSTQKKQHPSSSNPPPPPLESKAVKVKVEGRRRLCKLSSKNNEDEDDDEHDVRTAGLEEPSFAGIMDFDSPPVKIRDIVDDLSSKLDYLSIQKQRLNNNSSEEDFPPPPPPPPPICCVNKNETPKNKQQEDNNGDIPDYASAGSSFSFSLSPPPPPCSSNSSSGKAPKSRVHSGSSQTESKGDNFFDEINVENMVENKPPPTAIDRNTMFTGHPMVSGVVEDGNDEDDCVILSKKGPDRDDVGSSQACVVVKKEEVTDVISLDDSEDSSSVVDPVSVEDDFFTLSGKTSTYMLPGGIAKMLYPHQTEGLNWLWSLHCRGTGGILGDDMGLGKTMQVCSFLAGLFHSSLIKRALVVAPKTLLAHWIRELALVGLAEKTKEYYATSVKLREYELQYILQHSGILLTTYDIVRNNSKSLQGGRGYDDESNEDSIIWDYVILDEGHIIKNPSTQRAKSLLELPSSHRIIISGTPIQNNLKELWALFSFCCPELLGDKKEFKERYESPILRGSDKNATEREKRIGSTVAKELRERIEPFFLRRMKNEVSLEKDATKSGKLSEKNELIVWLKLTHCQRQLYKAFLNSEIVLSSFDGSPLAALTVMKKICDHPLLLTKRAAEDVLEGMDTMLNQGDFSVVERMVSQLANASDSEDSQKMQDNVSCKISFIISLLDNLIPEGHNVLIFSQTRKMLNLVQEAITLKGYRFLRIDGTTKASDREKIVNDFQEGVGAPIFLLTSQVGGLGLTLTKADRVIVVDPAWNPSTDNQSVDRAYRIGQKKDVIVYRLMTCGTIEEKIYKMQVFKGGLLKTATEHKEQTRYFSQQDLRELFSLPVQGFDVSVTQQQLHEEHDCQHIIFYKLHVPSYFQVTRASPSPSVEFIYDSKLLELVNDSLKNHIKFLESQGIAGVSHHSLLFSKTAPLQEDVEVLRKPETSYVGSSRSNSSHERDVDGACYAYNPKEVKLSQKSPAASSAGKRSESEIKDRIKRLQETLANKAMVSKLPDKGQKLEQQIFDLNVELDKIKMTADNNNKKEVIDLDDLCEEVQRISV